MIPIVFKKALLEHIRVKRRAKILSKYCKSILICFSLLFKIEFSQNFEIKVKSCDLFFKEILIEI